MKLGYIVLTRCSTTQLDRKPTYLGGLEKWNGLSLGGVTFNKVDRVGQISVESLDGKHIYEMTLCTDAIQFLADIMKEV